jgi:hypothetical protein
MRQAARSGRLGILAVGMGIGAALASTPQVASADSSTDPSSWLDQLASGISLPAASAADAASPLDFQISISGYDLFPTVDNTASATSGFGNIAIAIGNGAHADAAGGIFNFALADGTDTSAATPVGADLDFAVAEGTGSSANIGLGADLDFAFASGAGSSADIGLGASLDNATAIGTGSTAIAGAGSSLSAAFADGTSSDAVAGAGNGNLATALGTNSTAITVLGNGDLATASGGGSATAGGFLANAFAAGVGSTATATGFSDSATALGGDANAQASGIGDLAYIVNTGSALDQATASGGDNLIAEIIGTGSTAEAGFGNWDLAAAIGDMLHAMATGGNFLLDIMPSL